MYVIAFVCNSIYLFLNKCIQYNVDDMINVTCSLVATGEHMFYEAATIYLRQYIYYRKIVLNELLQWSMYTY